MLNVNHIKTIVSFFIKAGFRGKRTKIFFLLTLVPSLIFIIAQVVSLLNPDGISVSRAFAKIGGPFYFQLFIQVLALFYGTSVLSDEVDNKTLIYLTTSPVSRASILMGKYLSHFVIVGFILTVGLFLSYVIANFSHLLETEYLLNLGAYLGVGLLAMAAYSAFFVALGAFMKKSIVFGLFFIFGWESVVQFFPGTTQKMTICHYVKSLLPHKLDEASGFLSFRLSPSSGVESVLTLLLLTAAFLALSIFLFQRKEYSLADQA